MNLWLFAACSNFCPFTGKTNTFEWPQSRRKGFVKNLVPRASRWQLSRTFRQIEASSLADERFGKTLFGRAHSQPKALRVRALGEFHTPTPSAFPKTGFRQLSFVSPAKQVSAQDFAFATGDLEIKIIQNSCKGQFGNVSCRTKRKHCERFGPLSKSVHVLNRPTRVQHSPIDPHLPFLHVKVTTVHQHGHNSSSPRASHISTIMTRVKLFLACAYVYIFDEMSCSQHHDRNVL